MKKTISIILAAVMLLSVFTITAFAGNGPSEKQDELGYRAKLYFTEDKPAEENPAQFYVFKDNAAINDAIEGASYDRATNTLSLVNFNHPELILAMNMMGEDFKINVTGDVILAQVIAWAEAYDCKISFIGTGSITVNPERTHDRALNIFCGKSDFTLHVDSSVNPVKFLSNESAITFDTAIHNDVNTLFSDGDKAITDFYDVPNNHERMVKIKGAYLSGERKEHGYMAQLKDWQPGTAAGINEQYVVVIDGEKYIVEKYIWDNRCGGYIPDPSFTPIEMTEDEFKNSEYVIETRPGSEKETVNYYEEGDTGKELKSGYIVDDPNYTDYQGDPDKHENLMVTDVDIDTLEGDDRETEHHLLPLVYNENEGAYEPMYTFGGSGFNAYNFYQNGLSYRYKPENTPFLTQEIVTGEFYKLTDEFGGLHAEEDAEHEDGSDPKIFDYNEDDTIKVDGEDYYLLQGPSNYSRDMLEYVYEHVGSYIDWFYMYPDYIRINQETESNPDETGTTDDANPTGGNETGDTNPDGTTGTLPEQETTDPIDNPGATDGPGMTDPPEITEATETTEVAETTESAETTDATETTNLPKPPVPETTSAEGTTDATESTSDTSGILPVQPTSEQQAPSNQPSSSDQQAATQPNPNKDDITPAAQEDNTPIKEIKKGVSVKQVDKFVTKQKTEDDIKGSVFGLLCARQKTAKKTSITVRWNKLSNAKYYVVYGSKCGTKKGQIPPFKKIKTIKTNSYTQKKLKKGTYYKYLIVALDKNKKVITSSKTVHVVTKGGKNGNDKTVTVNKKTVSLTKGKSLTLKTKEVPQSKAKKVKRHRKVKFESSNTKIAKVTQKGKITAKKKGTAYIYAYAQNGYYSKVKVTVK